MFDGTATGLGGFNNHRPKDVLKGILPIGMSDSGRAANSHLGQVAAAQAVVGFECSRLDTVVQIWCLSDW